MAKEGGKEGRQDVTDDDEGRKDMMVKKEGVTEGAKEGRK